MSYDDRPLYERETFLKNRLEALLKPVMGILSGRNAPGFLGKDSSAFPLDFVTYYIRGRNRLSV